MTDPEEIWSFVLALLILGGTIFFGLYSKRSYDLTMRRDFLLSRDVEKARDEAQRADRAKSEFLASASRELRTPLNAILGNVQLLRKSPSLSAEQEQMLSDAERASRTMTSLVEDVLLISNSGNRVELQQTPVRLGSLVADLEATVRVLVRQKSLRLDLPEGPVLDQWVLADEVHLRQILINLLGNAIKFTRTGRVGLRLRAGSDRLRFLVYHTGAGMDAGQIHQAFEPLYRGTNVATGEFAGTGLGLAIVQRLVAEQGGYVRLRSRLGQGACAYLGLPAVKIATPRPTPTTEASVELKTRPMRVLVIENDATNRYVLNRFLTLAGHSVLEATNGAEALELFQCHTVDCILSDIRLPDISGIDLLKDLTRLTEESPSGDVPVYAVTANALPSDLMRYQEAGFDGAISKPIEETAMLRVLENVLAGKSAFQGLVAEVPKPLSPVLADDAIKRLYNKSALECSDRLRTAVDADDLMEVAYLAHRTRGAALTYGDALNAEMASRLERRLSGARGLRLQAATEVVDRLESISNT